MPHVNKFLDEVTPAVEKNRTVIQRLIRDLNRGNFSALNEIYVTNWVCSGQPTKRGGEGIRGLMGQVFEVFGDAEAVVEDITAEGDQVTTRWIFKGTHTGEWLDMAPTHARVKVSGVTVDRLPDGKIVESSFSYDLANLRRQLEVNSEQTD